MAPTVTLDSQQIRKLIARGSPLKAKLQPVLFLILINITLCKPNSEEGSRVSVQELFPGEKWALPMENLGPLDGSPGITARDCGTCHSDHYSEWSQSTHAHALSDLQFQSELSKPSSPQWLCLNCHIPAGNQRKEIVRMVENGDLLRPVAEPNPAFDPEMRKEGVSCATCHLKEQDGKTVVIGPLGTGRAPHPVVVNREALQNRCLDCHNVNYKVSSSLVCFFNTGNELAESDLSHKACSDCHMPEIQRKIVQLSGDYADRVSHMHFFIGGGIPKEFALMDAQEKGGYRRGLGLKLLDYTWNPETKTFRFSVEMRNLNIGHYLPTGDPERFIKIRLKIFAPGNEVEKTYRIGQHWQWEPEAKQIQDNRLRSGEVRVWQESVSPGARPNRIRLEAVHIRLSEKNARYMEQSSQRVPEQYRSKIARLREHYPMQRLLHSEDILIPFSGQTPIQD